MRVAAVALAALMAAEPAAATVCRLALALGLDVSGSVDAVEYDLQLTGLAQALLSPSVRNAFLAMPNATVDLYIYEWSGVRTQNMIVPWTTIRGAEDLAAVATRLTTPEARARQSETAIGQAMLFGAARLAEQAHCWRHTLDISADGTSNIGPRPRDVRLDPLLSGVTVNALVVGVPDGALSSGRPDSISALMTYFQAEVIHGADAFAEPALGYSAYREAIEKKLLKELTVAPVAEAGPETPLRRQ